MRSCRLHQGTYTVLPGEVWRAVPGGDTERGRAWPWGSTRTNAHQLRARRVQEGGGIAACLHLCS